MSKIADKIREIARIDILAKGREQKNFIGRPFYLGYDKVLAITCDQWKANVEGIPQGSFLLAFYDGEPNVQEALLLRTISPTNLPTDDNNIKSMVEYYKENMEIAGRAGAVGVESKLDDFSRFEFGFSGLECSILGVFYKTKDGQTEFGADVENFYSANNYKIYKPSGEILGEIVNQRDDDDIPGSEAEFKIGNVRYSSSRRFQNDSENVPVWINSKDFLGKRTALFGMTRTGKSNTVKKIIQATVEISSKAKKTLDSDTNTIRQIRGDRKKSPEDTKIAAKEQNFIKEFSESFDEATPRYPVGQIIFDVNGEYANANMQDEGTAIFELYSDVERYSVSEKEGFKVLKINFYSEIEAGFSLIQNYFQQQGRNPDYINDFVGINLEKPEDYLTDYKVRTEYDRKKAAYLCCLKEARFSVARNQSVRFTGNKDINKEIFKTLTDSKGKSLLDSAGEPQTVNIEPGIKDKSTGKIEYATLEDAVIWFTQVWKYYDTWDFLKKYEKKKGYEWAGNELKAILRMLTQYRQPNEKGSMSGYNKLIPLKKYHSSASRTSFEADILQRLREGKIVIIDLSQGDPEIKNFYSEKICRAIFNDSMNRFVANEPNNFIQIYFEEAHNLFPKKDDKDLSDIYNRIAKEGAKLNLGMIYATQEVSSISSNILKNTQNWFIAHLNNEDELREIRKYYDFADFTSSLIRFSATNDKGFVRMKTYTNPFVVPIQIDRFLADRK